MDVEEFYEFKIHLQIWVTTVICLEAYKNTYHYEPQVMELLKIFKKRNGATE